MFKTRKTKAIEYIVEIIENYCRTRIDNEKTLLGILEDIQRPISRIDETAYYMWYADEQKKKRLLRDHKMIKGFVTPDGTVRRFNAIIEGTNRTAAMICYELGLLIGVNEAGGLVKCVNGKPEIVAAIIKEKLSEPPFETTDINDIPDEPAPNDEAVKEAEQAPNRSGRPNLEPEPKSQNSENKHPGSGVAGEI